MNEVEEKKPVNQTQPANSGTVNGKPSDGMPDYPDASIKEVLMKQGVQDAIKRYINVPDTVIIKKIKKVYTDDTTKETTQKVDAIGGTTIDNAFPCELTLLNITLDPVEAVNKKYRIIESTLGLKANMSEKNSAVMPQKASNWRSPDWKR